MGTTLFGLALLLICIIFIAKDSAAHRLLKLLLPKNKLKEYKRLHMIPGYAIYYLKKWEQEVKEGESDESNT